MHIFRCIYLDWVASVFQVPGSIYYMELSYMIPYIIPMIPSTIAEPSAVLLGLDEEWGRTEGEGERV